LESVSCASSRHGNGFFLHLAAASALTFASGRVRSPLPQSLLYGTFQVISLSVNYGIFSALVLAGGLWRSYPVLAAVGSLSPAVISYVLSKWVAFAKPRELAKLPASEGR
jgi:putative flippase GtrA